MCLFILPFFFGVLSCLDSSLSGTEVVCSSGGDVFASIWFSFFSMSAMEIDVLSGEEVLFTSSVAGV